MRMSPDAEESIRCSVSGCSCLCFKPESSKFRSCDRCGHGWVVHALEKLQAQPSSGCGPVEVVLPGLVFDLSSLVLYGAQAVPVRLKILLDRVYSVLTPEQVGHILHTLGWTLGDYVRGYMLQTPGGKVLDHWTMVSPEEEPLILEQFLRFGETRPIVELMTRQCLAAVDGLSGPQLRPAPKSCRSNIGAFIERNRGASGTFRTTREESRSPKFEKSRVADGKDVTHHFETSLLPPFHFPSSAFQCLGPAPKRHGPGEEGEVRGNVSIKGEHALNVKADPDKPNPAQSSWQPRLHSDDELDLHLGVATQGNTSAPSPFLSPSFTPPSRHPSISSSPSLFHPLPSFSSSFLCPIPASSFSSPLPPLLPQSSSLPPLQSSPCSAPSASSTGGRKGRVCCGVCGKSFYDKGTLKIHYNAVHLKIKHRCTVAGCTMVFSSLRSRNRHSANPNPRLHTGSVRDAHPHRTAQLEAHTRDKEGPVQGHISRNGLSQDTSSDSPPSLVNTPNGSHLQAPPPHVQALSAPSAGSTALVSAPVANHAAPGRLHDRAPVAVAHRIKQYGCIEGKQEEMAGQRQQWEPSDSIPKKKPRKSSMPVKIERVKQEGGRTTVEGEEG